MKDIAELTREAVAGMGIEIVDVQRAALGLLRVTIERTDNQDEGVTIEDCEKVSRQLSRVFEVEGIDYKRLEVGSPGVDRPLRTQQDFERFAGERVEVKLREPVQDRRVFQGILRLSAGGEAGGQYVVEYQENKGALKQVSFDISDVEKAKLDPLLDFKGRKR